MGLGAIAAEFKHLATKHGIKHHKCKPVERNYMYHFQDVGIPEKAKYLKVVYSAEYPALASDLAGRSFKRVFGGSQSCMELFLLKRDLMGPCWLNVKAATPTKAPFSWCKCEMQTADPKSVTRFRDQTAVFDLCVVVACLALTSSVAGSRATRLRARRCVC